ncbi:hypothetical protein OKW49_006396 [Paraburkholderia youngii]
MALRVLADTAEPGVMKLGEKWNGKADQLPLIIAPISPPCARIKA